MMDEKIIVFLEELESVPWFAHSGIPNEKYHMVVSLYEACDGWGKQYMEVWEPEIYDLEDAAADAIGDDEIDDVFARVSDAIGDVVWEKFNEYITRQHLEEQTGISFELFDMVKRDVAWACVERILDRSGFFAVLLGVYKEGYFPCSWKGTYPDGQAVVL